MFLINSKLAAEEHKTDKELVPTYSDFDVFAWLYEEGPGVHSFAEIDIERLKNMLEFSVDAAVLI